MDASSFEEDFSSFTNGVAAGNNPYLFSNKMFDGGKNVVLANNNDKR